MRKKYFVGLTYGFIHFSVEVASFYFIFSRISTSPLYWALALLFDALAFIPQGIFGSLTDRFPKLNIGVIGTVMMLAAFLIPQDIIGLSALALGNAMIHISGAQHTLRCKCILIISCGCVQHAPSLQLHCARRCF